MSKKAKRGKGAVGKRQRSPRRTGLPPSRSVVSETTMVSPKGRSYRVLRTTEKDPYDPPDKPPKRRQPKPGQEK